MNRIFFACIFSLAGQFIAGCDGGGLTPNQKAAANRQWNDARAGVLASLAADQYKSGDLAKCQETLDRALRLEPGNPALHLQAARLAIEQGKLDEAESHLDLVRKLDPSIAETDYLTGVVLQRWQQPQQARDAYAAAALKNPEELSYLLAEAEMLVSLNKPADALMLLQSRAALFEHSGVVRDEIGQLLVQQKQYADGINMLRQASILTNDDPTIREHLAFALFDDHQFAESAERLARLAKEPGYEKRADVYAALGECQSQTNQLTAARQNLESATRLNPVNGGYWLGLAKVSIQAKDLPAAESALSKATQIDPASGDAQCLLGYLRLKQNQLPESLAAFRLAADLDPSDSASVTLEGYVLTRMGRATDAKQLYAKALTLNPKDELANKLMASVDLHH